MWVRWHTPQYVLRQFSLVIRNEYCYRFADENTINVPLNVTGLGDSEYIAFVQHFVVPIINDFAPSLILVSSGFDAAFGMFFKILVSNFAMECLIACKKYCYCLV